jgi:hypothetical protein
MKSIADDAEIREHNSRDMARHGDDATWARPVHDGPGDRVMAELAYTVAVLRERADRLQRGDRESFLRMAATTLRRNGVRELEVVLLALLPDSYRHAALVNRVLYGDRPPPKRKLAGAVLAKVKAKQAL